ncbi:hypothetical protein [Georgenia soli]|nr:hypothetical protein [Georgenia soli]
MLATAAWGLLVGCAVSPPPAGQTADLPFPTFQRADFAPEARLAGTLVIEDGCLAVDVENVITAAVALPETVTWDPDAETVTVDGAPFTVGDQVAFGGGSYEVSSIDLEHRCMRGDEVFFVHTVTD